VRDEPAGATARSGRARVPHGLPRPRARSGLPSLRRVARALEHRARRGHHRASPACRNVAR
jgi:hypothetical protein